MSRSRLPRIAPLAGLAAVLLALLPAAPSSAAPFVVTKTVDSLDGTCDADCSLREAVIAANIAAGPDTVQLQAGTYMLTIEGDGEDNGEFGDLDVVQDLTILGAGPEATVIDGAWAVNPDRILHVLGPGTDLTLTGLTVRDGNESVFGGGGVLLEMGTSLAATDVDVRGNHGDFAGGVASRGTATFTRVRFVGNVGEASGTGGGAFYGLDGTSTFTDVAFVGNSSACCGGAVYTEADGTTFTNVTLSGNTASTGDGGAIYLSNGTNSFTNVTFSGNSSVAGDGGAVYAGPLSEANNVTMIGNTAGGEGGGFYSDLSSPTIRNSIVAGNSDTGGQSPDCGQAFPDAFISGGHNLIGSTTGCSFTPAAGDLVGSDPKVGPLADNGGFAETRALLPGSRAIDRGDPATCASTDQRGAPRVGSCDIGAYELVHCKGVVVNRVGTASKDVLAGTGGADGFLAQGGNDRVSGLGGKDAACLGAGNDRASGGGGSDRLYGEKGKDNLKGQGGKDLLVCGPGKKEKGTGGPGKDTSKGCELGRA